MLKKRYQEENTEALLIQILFWLLIESQLNLTVRNYLVSVSELELVLRQP